MKTSVFFILLLSLFLITTSCDKPKENEPKDIATKDLVANQRYDLQMLKNNEGALFGVYLDRFDGSVYIWKGGKKALRVAANELELPAYDVPSYSMNVSLNDKNNPEIYLFNAHTASLYQFSLGNMASMKEVKVNLE